MSFHAAHYRCSGFHSTRPCPSPTTGTGLRILRPLPRRYHPTLLTAPPHRLAQPVQEEYADIRVSTIPQPPQGLGDLLRVSSVPALFKLARRDLQFRTRARRVPAQQTQMKNMTTRRRVLQTKSLTSLFRTSSKRATIPAVLLVVPPHGAPQEESGEPRWAAMAGPTTTQGTTRASTMCRVRSPHSRSTSNMAVYSKASRLILHDSTLPTRPLFRDPVCALATEMGQGNCSSLPISMAVMGK